MMSKGYNFLIVGVTVENKPQEITWRDMTSHDTTRNEKKTHKNKEKRLADKYIIHKNK